MKGQQSFLLVIIMITMSSLQGIADVPESSRKSIEVVLETYSNYAGHLLGVAEIGYSSNYADRYKTTINPTDLLYLKQHAELLQWTEGDEGLLSYFFLTFPGYLNPDNKQELADYLTDLNTAIAQESFSEFAEKYNETIQQLDKWIGFNASEALFNYSDEVQMISRIFMNNYDSFIHEVWPIEKQKMQVLVEALNQSFDDMNLIERWESLTGFEFDAPVFQIAFSSGMENGPTGKSLSYSKDWYYSGAQPDWLIQQVCQEAGTRILANLCKGQYNTYDPRLCFDVYKALSYYMTEKILTEMGLKVNPQALTPSQEDVLVIFKAYNSFSPNIPPEKLYGLTLETYQKAFYVMNID